MNNAITIIGMLCCLSPSTPIYKMHRRVAGCEGTGVI